MQESTTVTRNKTGETGKGKNVCGCVCVCFPFIFISWRLITLPYCSGFCHTVCVCVCVCFKSSRCSGLQASFSWVPGNRLRGRYWHAGGLLRTKGWMNRHGQRAEMSHSVAAMETSGFPRGTLRFGRRRFY